MGWLPDLPDARDYAPSHPSLPTGFARQLLAPLAAVGAAVEIDQRPSFQPVYNQSTIGSCTAYGGIGIHEYHDARVFKRYTPLSQLFLYKVTRNFIGVTGDTGAEIRNMMGALATIGAPPEEYYPYDIARFDEEPAPFIYALAANYKGVQYTRLDAKHLLPDARLEILKTALVNGWPFTFGFTCYQSLDEVGATGAIAYPKPSERITGGHCVIACGFSDAFACPGDSGAGAFMIRNSWGREWGEQGYGWLPYKYFTQGIAVDCWTLTKAAWVDMEQFK